MQTSVYQSNRQQMLLMGSTIFVSVTAAVIVSTLLVMSLMKGEIASALTSSVKTEPTTTQVASTCAVPQSEQDQPAAVYNKESSVTPVDETASEPLHYAHYTKPAVNNSYNTVSNVSNTTTTNNVTNTELHKTTIIKDSFNKDSYNDNSQGSHNTVVVKDNTVNVDSNNVKNINSNNKVDIDVEKKTTNTVNNVNNTVNWNSNNTTDSNNTVNKNSNNTIENHLLSDNKVIIPVVPAVVPVPSV